LDIAIQWMTIERSLVRMRLAQASGETVPTGEGLCPIMQTLDEFHKSARSFLDSQAYRTYGIVSPPPDFDFTLAGRPPEVRKLADLVLSLRHAVLDRDWDRVALVSSDISGSITYAMVWGRSANQVIVRMYSQLLLAFGALTVFAGLTVWFFHGMMARSQRREKEGSAFSRAVLIAQEEERGRISRDLHDTVVQDMRQLSKEMDKIVRVDERTEREELYVEASILQTAIAGNLRDICNNLVPMDFDPQGLPDALRRLCLNFAERTGIDCLMEIADGAPPGFPSKEKNLQIFRIVQEALTNVEKHAKATKAIVELRSELNGNIVISITDDGVGLKPKMRKDLMGSLSGGTHLGIRGMNERAMLLGGSITINNNQGKGTQVLVRTPPPPPTHH